MVRWYRVVPSSLALSLCILFTTPAVEALDYDRFDSPFINTTKWRQVEFVRDIRDGKLLSRVRSLGPFVTDLVRLSNPVSVSSLVASVTLSESNLPGPGSFIQARLSGIFYNDGSSSIPGVGDIWAQIGIAQSYGSVPFIRFGFVRCRDSACSAINAQPLFESTFPDMNPTIGQTVIFRLEWDGALFTFAAVLEGVLRERIIDPSPFAPMARANPDNPMRAIGTTATGLGALVSATFGTVGVNGSIYDAFNAPEIDPTRWLDVEFVREIARRELTSHLRSIGVTRENFLALSDPSEIDSIQASVRVGRISANSARVRARLAGLFYNDGRGTGPPGDLTGDVSAEIGLFPLGDRLAVRYIVVLCDNPNCTATRLLSPDDALLDTVDLHSLNRLSIGWDGTAFTFRANDQAATFSPSVQPMRRPNGQFKVLSTRITCLASGCSGLVEASFDDVVLSSRNVEFRLPYPVGFSYQVTQGNNADTNGDLQPDVDGNHSRRLRYAFDFAMPQGSDIAAAAPGVVVALDGTNTEGGCEPRFGNRNNYLIIGHADGTRTAYLHLCPGCINVRQDDYVRRGQFVARSGRTGLVCGATGEHLHFQRQVETGGNITQSIAVEFSDVLSNSGVPVATNSYRSAFLSLVEGDPGIPGDGILVNASAGELDFAFDLRSPFFPLGAAREGLTVTVFLPLGPTDFQAVSFGIRNLKESEPCMVRFGAGAGLPSGRTMVEGVEGIYTNVPPSFVEFWVRFANQGEPGCNISVDDLFIDKIYLHQRTLGQFVTELDAVAIGLGQNAFPGDPVR